MDSKTTEGEIEWLAFEAIEKLDYKTAIKLLAPLADQGSVYALNSLGWIHACGPIYLIDGFLARKYYEQAWEKGGVEGYIELGSLLQREGKFDEACALFEQGQRNGAADDKETMKYLACMEGELLAFEAIEKMDYQRALAILLPLKDHDSIYVLSTLGWLYQLGLAGVTDKDLAGSFYRRALDLGNTEAFYMLGTLAWGQGEFEAARDAFQKGAAVKSSLSMSQLGQMMLDGIGGPIDVEQGTQILKAAAEQGHIQSKFRLLEQDAKMTSNIFRKAALKLKWFGIMGEMFKDTAADIYSPKGDGLWRPGTPLNGWFQRLLYKTLMK
jgi:uncharacterized protein